MAKELSVQLYKKYSRSGIVKESPSTTDQYDVAGAVIVSGVRSIATTETNIAISPISVIAAIWIKNNSATNFVKFGCVTGQLTSKLLPGKSTIYVPTANAFYLQADTAACDVDYEIYQTS
jgi:hypothetical protein